MDKTLFVENLKSEFPRFDFNKVPDCKDSIFGVASIASKSFREPITKALIEASSRRNIFVSDVMYKETKPIEKQFVYAIVYTPAKKRDYRCKEFYDIEHDKVFESAKNYAELLEKLKAKRSYII